MNNQEKANLHDEIRLLKSKLDEMKLIKNRKTNSSENYNKTMEEDLYYYKNLARDYERKLDDLKQSRMVKEEFSGLASMKGGKQEFSEMASMKGGKDFQNEEVMRKYGNTINQSNDQGQYATNPVSTIGNQSLENFRRNKVKTNQ